MSIFSSKARLVTIAGPVLIVVAAIVYLQFHTSFKVPNVEPLPSGYSYSKPTTFPDIAKSMTSPDSQKEIILKSGSSFFDSPPATAVIVRDIRSKSSTPIAIITENDSGSGIDAQFAWSSDSKQLFIKGSMYKGERFYYMYDTRISKLYDIN